MLQRDSSAVSSRDCSSAAGHERPAHEVQGTGLKQCQQCLQAMSNSGWPSSMLQLRTSLLEASEQCEPLSEQSCCNAQSLLRQL